MPVDRARLSAEFNVAPTEVRRLPPGDRVKLAGTTFIRMMAGYAAAHGDGGEFIFRASYVNGAIHYQLEGVTHG